MRYLDLQEQRITAPGFMLGWSRLGDDRSRSTPPQGIAWCSSTSMVGIGLVGSVGVDGPLLANAHLLGLEGGVLVRPRHRAAGSAWVPGDLTDSIRPLGAMDQVHRRFPHTLELRFDPQGLAVPLRPYAARATSRSDLGVCCDFLERARRSWGQRAGA